ncbi:hypothetical protein CEXT_718591 [Caerostris extrusa]|uniref:Uncharacterized protein n=1 Tax=Caerostris extrusa TaxID=172846 RepID=A0AAV4UST2_CAEEX|nr:hypothetical protein CEXT_718591 [Caerostris extrusa]
MGIRRCLMQQKINGTTLSPSKSFAGEGRVLRRDGIERFASFRLPGTRKAQVMRLDDNCDFKLWISRFGVRCRIG